MTAEILKTKSKEEVLNFIRERLSFGISSQIREDVPGEFDRTQHRRFEMSGYESVTGETTLFNQAILNEFAYLGIYDYTHYLFLDFYKGTPYIYLKYWNDIQNLEFDEFSAYTTSEIIYEIFNLTIFTNKTTRRRI
ncbi:hypothetical protein ABXT06_17530 [Flavobacterium sp. UW10123]|uniref:hypothetical protein n=1 Tax=Flavobacterium sp. UW10123 TaxID=3230800 RepID=UPI00339B25C4